MITHCITTYYTYLKINALYASDVLPENLQTILANLKSQDIAGFRHVRRARRVYA